MATSTKSRKPRTPAQTDKVLDAINLRYAVSKMADRYAQSYRESAYAASAAPFDEAAYLRWGRRLERQRKALQRLLDAGLSAYKAEVCR